MEPSLNFQIQTGSTQFKVPTELIKKNFKSIQKLIEKQKKQLTNDVAKINKNPGLSNTIKLEMVRKLIKNFESFESRLISAIAKDKDYRERLTVRLENLEELGHFLREEDIDDKENDKEKEGEEAPFGKIVVDKDQRLDLHNPNLINWYRDQANLLIVDYLIKSNIKSDQSIGLKLLKNLSVANPKLMKLIDYDLFENFNKVFVSIIEDHDLSLVLSWFEDNRNSLKKIGSNLEFEINYCKFLSYIEESKIDEAIKFSQVNLSKNGNRLNYQESEMDNYYRNLDKLKGIGGLLVYVALNQNNLKPISRSDSSFSSGLVKNSQRFHDYEKLLSDERWVNLSQVFIENFTKLYGISKNYPLFIYLSAGLSSLKTKSCYCNTQNTIFINDEDKYNEPGILIPSSDRKYRGPNYYYKILKKINHCPVCSPELYKLSRNLPYAQLITSIFNNPFKLPNGNIYPFDTLIDPGEKFYSEKSSLLRDGKLKDPLTNEIFLVDDCIRVYPA